MMPNGQLSRFSYFVNAYPFSTFASTENKLGLGSCKTILPLKYSAFLLVHSLQKRQIEKGLLYLALGSAKVSSFLKHPFHLLVKEQPTSQFFFSAVDSFLIVLLASQFSQPCFPRKGIAPIKSQKGSPWSLDPNNRKHL